jgi:hypothetical protein
MILIPGVVETTSNFVEHPEVVARRIEEAVARSAIASASSPRPIAASAPSPGANG